jgi:hypothetical protein
VNRRNRDERYDDEEGFGSHGIDQLSNDAASQKARRSPEIHGTLTQNGAVVIARRRANPRTCPLFEAYWPE